MRRSAILVAMIVLGACGTTSTSTAPASNPDLTTAASSPTAVTVIEETYEDMGRDHLSEEDAAAIIEGTLAGPDYNSDPPTSGLHASIWAACGIYRQPIPSVMQVHSLEHGAVIIHYRPDLDPEALEQLARELGAHIIVAPNPAISEPVVLSAWGVLQRHAGIDLDAVREFWNRYGNEGPERVPCPVEVDEAEAVSASRRSPSI